MPRRRHVGVAHFDRFFRTCRDLLTTDGIALVHSVGRFEGPRTITPWVQRHIFPGGHIPALSEAVPAVERSGLLLADIEILRLHYAETLRSWRERFLTRRAEVEAMYDERFCRMWEFYLVTGEASFRHAELMVFQLQLAKRLETLPLTRDYMIDVEGRLRDEERRATHRGRLKVASD